MTIDFKRRTLGKAAAILSASLGAPMLAGCSGPQQHADNRMMPGTVFTPEALKATAKGKTYVRDFVAVYGRPLRRMNDHVRHPDQKGYVWEWGATRPSFCSNLNDRHYMTRLATQQRCCRHRRRAGRDLLRPSEAQDASTRHHRHPTAHPRRTHRFARARGAGRESARNRALVPEPRPISSLE